MNKRELFGVVAVMLSALCFRSDLLCLGIDGASQRPQLIRSPHLRAELVDLNSADYAQLVELPFVGKEAAGGLIAYRREWGAFCQQDALRHAKGMGPSTSAKLAPFTVLRRPEDVRHRVNTMAYNELVAVSGIGPVLAARILAQREHVEGFRCVDELLSVPGVGWQLAARLWTSSG